MTIRNATPADIPAIVQLLKASLGDVSSKKSVDYWNWKHVTNPFGPSPVLVAEEEGQLIGVRAFMRWDWQEGGKIYRALRAVDTATHPAHQGRGIFKKLTLQLVETASLEGYDFIFNSPNTQSTPGYLKMGWEEWGKMPLWIRPVLSLRKYQPAVFAAYHQQLQEADLEKLPLAGKEYTGLSTVVSPAYFQWRYRQCPVKEYGLYKTADAWIFFSVKEKNRGMELRVCQVLQEGRENDPSVFKAIRKLAIELGCRFITVSGLQQVPALLLLRYGYLPAAAISVTITIRRLANEPFYQSLHGKKDWMLETGAVELF